jgi:hypothetical protein
MLVAVAVMVVAVVEAGEAVAADAEVLVMQIARDPQQIAYPPIVQLQQIELPEIVA